MRHHIARLKFTRREYFIKLTISIIFEISKSIFFRSKRSGHILRLFFFFLSSKLRIIYIIFIFRWKNFPMQIKSHSWLFIEREFTRNRDGSFQKKSSSHRPFNEPRWKAISMFPDSEDFFSLAEFYHYFIIIHHHQIYISIPSRCFVLFLTFHQNENLLIFSRPKKEHCTQSSIKWFRAFVVVTAVVAVIVNFIQ